MGAMADQIKKMSDKAQTPEGQQQSANLMDLMKVSQNNLFQQQVDTPSLLMRHKMMMKR